MTELEGETTLMKNFQYQACRKEVFSNYAICQRRCFQTVQFVKGGVSQVLKKTARHDLKHDQQHPKTLSGKHTSDLLILNICGRVKRLTIIFFGHHPSVCILWCIRGIKTMTDFGIFHRVGWIHAFSISFAKYF